MINFVTFDIKVIDKRMLSHFIIVSHYKVFAFRLPRLLNKQKSL